MHPHRRTAPARSGSAPVSGMVPAGALAGMLALSLVLAGCGGSSQGSGQPGPRRTRSAGASTRPAPPPERGSCHRLTLGAATRPVDASRPVPCSEAHTSQTFYVGRLQRISNGHLLTLDADRVQRQLGGACDRQLTQTLGGGAEARRISQFEAVWFQPDQRQAAAGAAWYRCDAVAVRSRGRLLDLPVSIDGVLGGSRAGRYATCGTAAPDHRGFQRVVCAERHSWRAVSTAPLGRGTTYLSRSGAATGDAACRQVAQRAAHGSLSYAWSFQWPTRAQWRDGQRFGYCWLPDR